MGLLYIKFTLSFIAEIISQIVANDSEKFLSQLNQLIVQKFTYLVKILIKYIHPPLPFKDRIFLKKVFHRMVQMC